jgi:O-antigen/teichoic acid export membrane protein
MAIRYFLIAVEARNRALFLFELCCGLLFIALLIPMTLYWGVAGAIIATGISQGTKLISNLALARQVKSDLRSGN